MGNMTTIATLRTALKEIQQNAETEAAKIQSYGHDSFDEQQTIEILDLIARIAQDAINESEG